MESGMLDGLLSSNDGTVVGTGSGSPAISLLLEKYQMIDRHGPKAGP